MSAPRHHPLASGLPPDWAVGWGEDRWGAFADAAFAGVVQRFRWISPGRFWMGSPLDEVGRQEQEGPQHEVILTRGFWLGDTPVTQALWQAVTGENPSRFVSPDRPVEQVSWEECAAFCEQLGLRLPTEAEWEYACRAGTTGATWRGRLIILGLNNAPGLDEIAWYGGNSGKEFDLDKGYDSTGWPEKQHSHEQAGTRPVKGKRANPWGLYDMLGNVYEWCQDAYAPLTQERCTDPSQEHGAERVLRGGSWYDVACDVRAAWRVGNSAGDRFDNLGFRLARDPSPSEVSGAWNRRGALGAAQARDDP